MMRKRVIIVKAYKIILAALLALSILVGGASAFTFPRETPETVHPQEKLIRLHVVANSDSAPDQALKRQVRDKIVSDLRPELLGTENIDSARAIVTANLGRIREIAAREIKAQGKDYPVIVELASFPFPTKHYGSFVLPAGDYEAVRVVIGSGGGANWWCVLFPPLCFVNMSETTPASGTESTPAEPGEGVRFEYRLRILDLFS